MVVRDRFRSIGYLCVPGGMGCGKHDGGIGLSRADVSMWVRVSLRKRDELARREDHEVQNKIFLIIAPRSRKIFLTISRRISLVQSQTWLRVLSPMIRDNLQMLPPAFGRLGSPPAFAHPRRGGVLLLGNSRPTSRCPQPQRHIYPFTTT